MSDLADRRRRAYLDAVFERMAGNGRPAVLAKAVAVIDLWERNGIHPRYPAVWRRLLAGDVGAMRDTVQADTPEAADLRHCMPFAGALSNQERAAIRERIR